MPSFDVVSAVDPQELRNAVDQTNRELSTRYDFRGTGAHAELAEDTVTVEAEATEFVIRVQDDGAGVDLDAVRKRALERGMIDRLV